MSESRKIAFVFPGQGAQYIGMGMDFVAADPTLQAVLSEFDRIHGVNLAEIMAKGPEDSLKETRFTQPAILFHSIAAYRALQAVRPLQADFVAGHSLGEFTALTAAGALSLPDAMHLVHKRGEFMIAANEGKPFAMSAILGLSPDQVRAICVEASAVDVVIAANFNTPTQTVISGSEAGVRKAEELAKAAGAKRCVPLVVGGPFHSPLIARAGEWLAEEIARIDFQSPSVPVVSNVDAQPTSDVSKIRNNLVQQVTSSVLWVDSLQTMIDHGVRLFVEFGPQKVLSGMVRALDKEMPVLNIDKIEDVAQVANDLANIL